MRKARRILILFTLTILYLPIASTAAAASATSQAAAASQPAPLAPDDAAHQIQLLRTLRRALTQPARQGSGEVEVSYKSASASPGGHYVSKTLEQRLVTFSFNGNDCLLKVTDPKRQAGTFVSILRAGQRQVMLAHQISYPKPGVVHSWFQAFLDKRETLHPGIPRIARPDTFNWTYADLTAVPDGYGDEALFRNALGNGNIRGEVSRDGNIVIIRVWDKVGLEATRLQVTKFDLALGGVPIFFSEHDDNGKWDWSNQIEWRLDDGAPVPTRLVTQQIMGTMKDPSWLVDWYSCDFKKFSLHALPDGALSIRALEIPPGSNFDDDLGKTPTFRYGETNLKKFLGLDAAKDLADQPFKGDQK